MTFQRLLLLSIIPFALASCGGDSGGSSGTTTGTNAPSGTSTGSTTGAGSSTGQGETSGTGGQNQTGGDQTGGQQTGGQGTGGEPTTGGTTTNGTTTGTTGPDFSNANSGLSHPGVELPNGSAAQQSGALFSAVGRNKVDAMPQNLAVVFEVVENHGPDANENCKSLAAEYASCSVANIHIKDSTASLNDGNWRLYFHSIRRILRVDSSEFKIFHVNGDLNYIAPSDGFAGFNNTPSKTIKVVTEFNYLHESDMMPRYFLVRNGGAPELLPNTNDESDVTAYAVEITGDNRKAFNGEPHELANSVNRFDKYAATSPVDASTLIVPTPDSISVNGGTLNVDAGISFPGNVLSAASAAALNQRMAAILPGGSLNVTHSINASLPAGQYSLDVTAGGISIIGHDAEAVFNGSQSLISLVTPGSGTLPLVSVTDSPRFSYRGMHIDVARNFHSIQQIQKVIDQMSAYKMNVLHMHLSDDEGWRLEIPGLPELTSVGGKRQFALDGDGNPTEATSLLPQLGSGPGSNNQGSGFYTRAQFIQLLQYANARYVQVIPELDMPAHARAAVVAMRARASNLGEPGNPAIRVDDPEDDSRYLTVQHYDDGILNPCIPGTYNFLQTIVTEVKAMYDEAGSTLDTWHMGGDEAKNVFKGNGFEDITAGSTIPWKGDIDQSQYHYPWERSPACQQLIASDSTLNNLDDLTELFVVRLSEIVNNAGIPSLYAYQDILRNLNANQLATPRAGVGFWEVVWEGGYQSAYQWPNRGFETVVAVPDYLYFDFPQEIDPKERGYYWATRFTDTQKVFTFAPENLPQNAETSVNRSGEPFTASSGVANQTFVGMQGQLWSETVRTAEHFDYMVFPRLLALAERAWHRAPWEVDYVSGATYSATSGIVDQGALAADWNAFANALGQKELPKLDAAGVQYRIPTAGAKLVGGQLEVNTQYPGLAVEYSTDGSNWSAYNPDNKPANAAMVRARSANGARVGRATPVN